MIRGETIESSFPISFTRTVYSDETGDGCTIEVLVTGDSTGFFKLFSPLMDLMISRSIKQDYAQLKKLFEG
jgi:hypothetical protein